MVNFYLSENPVHNAVIEAFYDGCAAEKKLIEGFAYEPGEVAVVFGVDKSKVKVSWPRGRIISQQRKNNGDVLVLETGYINRGDGKNHHYAAGFNGLNGRADFRNKNMGPERLAALGLPLRPYSRGKNVILCGQVPWDASVDHHNHVEWLNKTAEELKQRTTRPIIFRPHPLADLPPLPGCEFSKNPFLYDLSEAHCVVTFNSNCGVEALFHGKPVFALDEGSMCWSVCSKDLKDIEEPWYPAPQLRIQWARDLAHTQWTLDEMREGLAWRHLFR